MQGWPWGPRLTASSGFCVPISLLLSLGGWESGALDSGSVLSAQVVCFLGSVSPSGNQRKAGTTQPLASRDAVGTVPRQPIPKEHSSSPSLAARLSESWLPWARGGRGEHTAGQMDCPWSTRQLLKGREGRSPQGSCFNKRFFPEEGKAGERGSGTYLKLPCCSLPALFAGVSGHPRPEVWAGEPPGDLPSPGSLSHSAPRWAVG